MRITPQDLSFDAIQQMKKFKKYTPLFKKHVSCKESSVLHLSKSMMTLNPKGNALPYPSPPPMTLVKSYKALQTVDLANNTMAVCLAQLTTNEEGSLPLGCSPTQECPLPTTSYDQSLRGLIIGW